MTERTTGSRARGRARDARPTAQRQGAREPRPQSQSHSQNPLIAAAQILLGVGLSCLAGALCLGLLAGLVLGILYLSR